MSLDVRLIGLVALVWAIMAALYASVPMLAHMPGSVLLWGSGAGVFALLAAAVWRAGESPRAK